MMQLHEVNAYCPRNSGLPGDRIAVHWSTREARFDLVVAREGASQEEVWRKDDITGTFYPDPPDVVENGCGWPAGIHIPTQESWRSGYYSVRMLQPGSDRLLGETFFVLRARNKAKILLVLATNTYNAYNWYGGASLYSIPETGILYNVKTHKVSFERPLPRGYLRKHAFDCRLVTIGPPDRSLPVLRWAEQHGYDPFSCPAGWFNWEYPLVQWLEREGMEVDLATNLDLETVPDLLDGYTLYISCGKDEYWTSGARDAVETFTREGGNAIFLGGCTAFWQVRIEDDGRSMVCYKLRWREDPVLEDGRPELLAGLWSNRLTGRPENSMSGLSFARGGYARFGGATPRGIGGYVVYRPEHWSLEGTSLEYGDVFGAENVIAGYECDGCAIQLVHGLPVPTGEDGTPSDLEIVAMFPAALLSPRTAPPAMEDEETLTDLEYVADQLEGGIDEDSLRKYANGYGMMAFHRPGGLVFAAGATDWVYGLINADPLVTQITRNIVRRMLG